MAEQKKRLRVFTVDDEQNISWTLTTILRGHGFEAIAFTRPLEALKLARSEAPDLVVSDIDMPLLSGIDLAIQLRACCPNCKVLLVSGHSAAAMLLESARSKGYDLEFLSKPVDPKTLLKKVEEMTGAIPSLHSAAKERACNKMAENMLESFAELKASIAASETRISEEHKRPAKRIPARSSSRMA
ncbi:MAG: response regulator [Acidobacteriaceae bacterium]